MYIVTVHPQSAPRLTRNRLLRVGGAAATLGLVPAAAQAATGETTADEFVALAPATSDRNVVEPTVDAVPLTLRTPTASTSPNLILDRVDSTDARTLVFTTSENPWRLTTQQIPGDGGFLDQQLFLNYNRRWDRVIGWVKDDPAREAVSWVFESYWQQRNMEWNIDLFAPGSTVDRRPFGFEAAYDGTKLALMLGGATYDAGAASVSFSGGTEAAQKHIEVKQRTGVATTDSMFSVRRANGTYESEWRTGIGDPRLIFSLDGVTNAGMLGVGGTILFWGHPHGGATNPVLDFRGNGTTARLLASSPVLGDSADRFRFDASGKLEWGPGTDPVDVVLSRTGPATLTLDGHLRLPNRNVVLGTDAGTMIGTSKDQKLGVFGKTPVAQQRGGPGVAGQVYGVNEQGMIQRMYDALRTYGWLS